MTMPGDWYNHTCSNPNKIIEKRKIKQQAVTSISIYLVEPSQLLSTLNTQRGLGILPSPGRRSFWSTPQKGTKKGTAQGTGLPWLALRRREANSHATGVLRQCLP